MCISNVVSLRPQRWPACWSSSGPGHRITPRVAAWRVCPHWRHVSQSWPWIWSMAAPSCRGMWPALAVWKPLPCSTYLPWCCANTATMASWLPVTWPTSGGSTCTHPLPRGRGRLRAARCCTIMTVDYWRSGVSRMAGTTDYSLLMDIED